MNARMRRTTAGPAGVRATARPSSGAPRPRPPAATRVPTGTLTVLVRRAEAGTIRAGSTRGDSTATAPAARPGRPAQAATDGPRHGAAIRLGAPQEAVPRHAGRRLSPPSPRPGRPGPERSRRERPGREPPGPATASAGRRVWPLCRVMPEGRRGPEGPTGAWEPAGLTEALGLAVHRGRLDPGDRAAGARCAGASGSPSSPPPP
jgi:hypothetical protein